MTNRAPNEDYPPEDRSPQDGATEHVNNSHNTLNTPATSFQQKPKPETQDRPLKKPNRALGIVLVGGVAVAIFGGVGLWEGGRRNEQQRWQDEYLASGELYKDGFRADILGVGATEGNATLILGKGAVECFIDGVRFTVTRAGGTVADTSNYTLRVTTAGKSNEVRVQDADQLGAILGPNPCSPSPNDPRADGLR